MTIDSKQIIVFDAPCGDNGGKVRTIKLNRPEAINALNIEMVSALRSTLVDGLKLKHLKAVMVEHAVGRGFCAGGDIAMLRESGATNGDAARAFFHAEYQTNHLIANYPIPYVAFMDGITMGGGVGLSIHGTFRVATQNTIFAMPETGIGLLPDVGGGWFLPRLKSRIGTYLALTGARIRAADCLEAGIATHFVKSENLPAVKHAILNEPELSKGAIEEVLNQYAEPAGDLDLLSVANQKQIATHFCFDNVRDIFASLSQSDDIWAQSQLALLKTKSPQTLVLAIEQLRRGNEMASLEDVLAMEYRLSTRVISLHDFQEGVRAVLIDKDLKPIWNDKTIEDVNPDFISNLFAPLIEYDEWTPLKYGGK
jgi:enoyl-CoA hydratase